MAELGLRERKKIQRRTEIIAAAHELFAERGYDATTVVDIAEAADVAPRTVSLYFPTKQDIALAGMMDLAVRFSAALCLRQPGESTIEVIGAWLRAELAQFDPRELELQSRMLEANPELRALGMTRVEAAASEGMGWAIAAELGVANDDPRVHIAVAAIGSIIESVFTASQLSHAVDETIDIAVRFLTAGMASLRST
jgi:AcrR family transcriptional regulator